jgi:hypothetical protein
MLTFSFPDQTAFEYQDVHAKVFLEMEHWYTEVPPGQDKTTLVILTEDDSSRIAVLGANGARKNTDQMIVGGAVPTNHGVNRFQFLTRCIRGTAAVHHRQHMEEKSRGLHSVAFQ